MKTTSDPLDSPAKAESILRWSKRIGFREGVSGKPSLRYRNGFLLAFYLALVATGLVALYIPELRQLHNGELPHWARGFLAAMIGVALLLLTSLWIAVNLALEIFFGKDPGKN